MRVARWRSMLVAVIVVLAGCVPQEGPVLPAGFLEAISRPGRPTFVLQPPPPGAHGQDVAAVLRAHDPDPMYRGRAIPVYGMVDCNGYPDCEPRPVWVLFYPDCTDGEFVNVSGVVLDPGWVTVDAATGVPGGYWGNSPC